MSDINFDLRSGVITMLLSGTSALKTALTKAVGSSTFYRLYYDEVPQVYPGTQTQIVPPWVVLSILPLAPWRDSATKFFDVTVQLSVAALSQKDADDIAGYVDALMDDCEAALTIGTRFTVKVMPGPRVNLPKQDNVYNVALQYSLTIQQ